MVTFGVLGPLVARDERGPVGLRGPRHRSVLARLLIARRRVVPVRLLVDDLWDDPPEGAVGAVQTFVAALRQAVEPDRPPRTPATLLVTEAPGYVLRAAPDAVDAWRFEDALAGAAGLLAADRAEAALSGLDDALALWRGPAYSEFAEEHWARAEVDRLHELRLLAVERRAEAALALGRADAVAADLRAHVADHPWREHAWCLLALALYRAGRQRDALDALRTARTALRTELGVDPGPELRRVEADVLAQDPRLSAPVGPAAPVRAAPPDVLARPALVGRAQELAVATAAAEAALAGDRLGLVLVSGEAGAGKTAFAEALTAALAARGWTTAGGRDPEREGVPGAWPWTQILDALAAAGHAPAPAATARPDGAEDPATARFRAHRAVVSHLGAVAERGPLLLVLDDLHLAGEETLALLATLIGEPPARPVLLVGTFRTTGVSPGLAALLGRAARAEPVRIYLGELPEAAVGELVRATTSREVAGDTVRVIRERSGGNPFFVRELARLFDAEGDCALSAVPAGVRDVIRYRLSALPEAARTVLQRAAVIGRDVDLDLLVPLAGDEDLVLDAVDSALLLGFLVESGGDPPRFAHALVRDTLYEDVSGTRRARWHAAVADALEDLRPDDVDALAHHLLLAGSRSTAARAARYAGLAAGRAERRFAPHEAARLWRAAITAHDRVGTGDARARLDLVTGLVRALAVTGDLESARRHRAEAITEAGRLGDAELTAGVIGAFDVPGIWTVNDDPELAEHVVAVAERTLAALPGHLLAERSRLLGTIAMELRGTRSARGREAAQEAERIARELGSPALLAFALNGRFMHTFHRTGLAPRRAEIGRELVALAAEHDLVTFAVLGHLVLVQSHSALAEFTAADEHAAAADLLAEQHGLPVVGVFTEWYAALRLAAAGRGGAEAAYRAAAARLDGTGMRGVEVGTLPLALLCLRMRDGAPADVDLNADWGPHLDWVRPLGLLTAGNRAGALAALRAVPDTPGDLLAEVRLCLLAEAALGLRDRSALARAHAELLPAAGELAGAGSGLVTLGPVAGRLARLATALGRPAEAREHRRRADEIAGRASAAR
ncbi:BTAD domain-containing putative transcriptional regulator [Umezawaea beigongshangensis]|uniref:BTAD domain-containing putative transcriptional regulator n=1 Tax=Umezawaea beigongshangensis TaxID=2780383 RepID=UPI0027DC996E|nr:BTAD domain-containing putative transcriptional regulator [Umezawaea beigongshangensis]